MSKLLEFIFSALRLPRRVAHIEVVVAQQHRFITKQQEEIDALESRLAEFDVRGAKV